MLDFDEAAFDKIFSAATLRFGFYDAMIHVVYPFLGKVGILWSVNKTAHIQEHFAANIIKRKLMSAIDGLMPASKKDKKFLLFLPPGEWHEIGLLFANYIIRAKGYQSIYLGQDVPVENIEKIIPVVRPDHLLLFYITTRPKEEIAQQIIALSKMDKQTKILVAGSSESLPESTSKLKNTTYLTDVNSLLNFL
jgi:methanogenic corrinoid protein MtbC1